MFEHVTIMLILNLFVNKNLFIYVLCSSIVSFEFTVFKTLLFVWCTYMCDRNKPVHKGLQGLSFAVSSSILCIL